MKFPPISPCCYFQECVTGGSSSLKVLLLKHPKSLEGPIEILSLSPTLLVALQDYGSSYSSVSKRLNRPLEKAMVSQRRRAHLCSSPQETDFSRGKKKCTGWFLPRLKKKLLLFMGESGEGWGGGRRVGGRWQLHVSEELFTINPPPKSFWSCYIEKTNDSNERINNNWHIFMGHLFITLLELCGQALY